MAHYLRNENLFKFLLHTEKQNKFQMNQSIKCNNQNKETNVGEFPQDSQEKDFLSIKTITEIIKGGLMDFDYSISSPKSISTSPISQTVPFPNPSVEA